MTTLGRYQIFDKLGTGSMGTVYRAQDTILEREVALKTIRTEGDVHPELRERFYREARACARLQHPSIVVVHDLGEIDQVAYIAMELLNGADFRKLIEQRVEIPLTVKLEALAQVCSALSYAHRQGIVHRDVKPSNLFLIENRHAKVLDFGIARLPSSRLTLEGKVLGTPNYMAPEQIQGKPADARSDLFSAAVVFFEFLTYVHPFNGDNIPQRIVEDAPDALATSERRLPILLERVFARGLAKDPERRYQNGDEFGADLRAISDALLQNASPSFSRAPLPSERDVTGRAAPPGEDLYEQRLSELMQSVPEFEDAIAQGDTNLARQILVRLEAIGTVDSRFAEPVRLCRARLADLESPGRSAEHGSQTQPSSDPGTGSKTCGYCGGANRSAAVYCIQCGARLPAWMPAVPDRLPVAGAPTETPAPLEFGATVIGQIPAGAPPAAVAEDLEIAPPVPESVRRVQPAAPKPGLAQENLLEWWARCLQFGRKQKQFVWLGAGLLAAIVAMIVVARALQPISREQEVAAAQVRLSKAFLYAKRREDSKSRLVFNGELINLLELPKKPDQWVSVQLIRNRKPMWSGYMRTTALWRWGGSNSTNTLRLKLLFETAVPGADADVQQELYDLQKLVKVVTDAPLLRQAHARMAGLELLLAQHMKGQSGAPWQDHLDLARQHYLEAGADGAGQAILDEFKRQIDDLAAQVAPPLAPPPQQPTSGTSATLRMKSVDRWLKQARDLVNNKSGLSPAEEMAKLEEAEKYVDKILESQSDNKDAQSLQEFIRNREDYLATRRPK